MPWGDWQFWVVTLVAAGAIALMARAVWPRKRGRKAASLTVSAPKR